MKWLLIILFPLLAYSSQVDITGKLPTKNIGNVNLAKKPTIVLEGPISKHNMKAIAKELDIKTKKSKNINLIISSGGGGIFVGLILIKKIEELQAINKLYLKCYIKDFAYSMAAIISAYCDKVYISKFGSIMHHEAVMAAEGSLTEVRQELEFAEEWLNQVDVDTALRYNISTNEWFAFIKKERWFSAKTAAQYGLVDGIFNTLHYNAKAPKKPESPFGILFFIERLLNGW